MTTYKVEKDGIAFYVQPEMLDWYASDGYTIYKTVEEEVLDVAAEIARIEPDKPIVKEATANG